jgi:predicted metalloprotease with PDZ domain
MKLRLFIPFAITLLSANFLLAQNRNKAYQYRLDLKNLKDDKAKVELIVPEFEGIDSIEFHFPKIVPGTYSIYDFGRFVHDFSAEDASGNTINFDRLDANRWLISEAGKLHKISYWVEDSYDTEKDTVIFEPAGTNFEEGKNYLINTFGVFGYLEPFKRAPFDIQVIKPEGFYGATPLNVLMNSESNDRFLSVDYYELTDSPIMYSIPDTSSLYLGDTEVMVSVYSPNKKLGAEEVMSQIQTILKAQAAYLGGDLPVEKYVILIYLFDNVPLSQGAGALEHSYSTVFSLREIEAEKIATTIRDVTAHEFFHIITPLTIHSEEIHDFDFQNPEMSKHLWLYEGLTEYAAGHVQLKEGLMSFGDYLALMRGKLRYAKARFNDTLPFTELSEGCLDEYEDQYTNVYMKGAWIGLCLDILLRDYSEGSYGTQNMVSDLSRFYGEDKAFKDDELFTRIAMITYPQIEDFFKKYIEGSEPLPVKDCLEKIGVEYLDSLVEDEVTFGDVGLGYNPENDRLVVRSVDKLNDFGKAIGFQVGDEIVRINGVLITGNNFNKIVQQIKSSVKEGETLNFSIARYNKKGKEKIEELSAPAVVIQKTSYHIIREMENPTEEQLALRKAWGNI